MYAADSRTDSTVSSRGSYSDDDDDNTFHYRHAGTMYDEQRDLLPLKFSRRVLVKYGTSIVLILCCLIAIVTVVALGTVLTSGNRHSETSTAMCGLQPGRCPPTSEPTVDSKVLPSPTVAPQEAEESPNGPPNAPVIGREVRFGELEAFYLLLSNEDLWNVATNGTRIGKYCYILNATGMGQKCNYYAKARPGLGQDNGVPLTFNGRGSGCIKDNDDDSCYYYEADYSLTIDEREAMCTSSVVSNGAAQIRYAVEQYLCTDVGFALGGARIPEPTSAPTTLQVDTWIDYSDSPSFGRPFCEDGTFGDLDRWYLSLSDEELWEVAINGTKIGQYCYIQDATAMSKACNYYAKGRPGFGQYNGVPLTWDGRGIGCIKDQDYNCRFYDWHYPLTEKEREAMCISSVISNGAAQIRCAISNCLCMDPGLALADLVRSPPPSPAPTKFQESETNFTNVKDVCQETFEFSEEWYLSMSDEELWDAATNGTRIGQYCYIQDATASSSASCNYYAKGRPGSGQYNGVPLTNDGRGTGCIKEDDGDFCYFRDLQYQLTDEERDSMCTSSVIANGAAQIRYAINNCLCTDVGLSVSDVEEDALILL